MGCGGTLIGNKIVVTAVHCICRHNSEVKPDCNAWKTIYNRTHVVVGDHDKLKHDKGEMSINVETAIAHPKFTGIYGYLKLISYLFHDH